MTPEVIAAIAAALRANDLLTVQAACIDAGVSPGAVKAAIKRLHDGAGGENVAPIVRAVDAQCESLLRRGEAKADDDEEEESVELAKDTTSMASKSDAELLAIINGGKSE